MYRNPSLWKEFLKLYDQAWGCIGAGQDIPSFDLATSNPIENIWEFPGPWC
jgi:hypothetical protein